MSFVGQRQFKEFLGEIKEEPINYEDPLGIYSQPDINPKLRVASQVVDGRTVFSRPTTSFLKRFNRSLNRILTPEEREMIRLKVHSEIETNWAIEQKEQSYFSSPVNIGNITNVFPYNAYEVLKDDHQPQPPVLISEPSLKALRRSLKNKRRKQKKKEKKALRRQMEKALPNNLHVKGDIVNNLKQLSLSESH